MAKAQVQKKEEEIVENIIPMDLEDACDEYFTTYGGSVLLGRAIPAVEDGLTPVNRRILYTMDEENISNFKKGAYYNGMIMSRYHPHGDLSLWDTTVGLTQWWKNQFQFIVPQGNNGTVGGKSAAAMRYLEVKLSPFTKDVMFTDIDKNIVDTVDNYDKTRKIASVLPTKFPVILNSGIMGIASGFSVDIPIHSVADICSTTLALMEDPDLDSKALAAILQGPDFPTGGDVINASDLPDMYASGQGVVRVRGRIELRTIGNKDVVVITGIPPKCTVGGIEEEIVALCKEVEDKKTKKRAPGPLMDKISDIKNLSKGEVVEVIITPKRDVAPSVLRNMLFDLTSLTYSHKYIMNVLIGGEFKPNVPLHTVIGEWIKFRVKTVRRKYVFLVQKTLERVTILSALIKASKNIDAILTLMKTSTSKDNAKEVLIHKYDFAEKEAEYIVEQKLYKISNIEVDKLREEMKEKKAQADGFIEILGSEDNIRQIIREELEECKQKYGKWKRRTTLQDVDKLNHIDLVKQEELLINISTDNYIYSTPVDELRDSNKGNKGFLIIDTKRKKILEKSMILNSHDELFVFTDKGKMFILHGYQLNVDHVHISNIIPDLGNQKVVAFVPVRKDVKGHLIFTTSSSFTKRCDLAEYQTRMRSDGLIAQALNDNEVVVNVLLTESESDLVILTTSRGYASKMPVKNIPVVRRTTKGRKLIRMKDAETVVSMALVDAPEDKTHLLFITTKGKGKMVLVKDLLYKKTETGMSAAFLAIKLNAEDQLRRTEVIKESEQIVVTSKAGKSIKIDSDQINTYGRSAKGGRIISLNGDDEVAAITVV
jgi:DNA gyrase subunit A